MFKTAGASIKLCFNDQVLYFKASWTNYDHLNEWSERMTNWRYNEASRQAFYGNPMFDQCRPFDIVFLGILEAI